MNIPVYPELERKLSDLLNSNSSTLHEIDFIFFSELVGHNFQPVDLMSREINHIKT